MTIDISFVIPCYKSEDTVEFVINEIKEKMREKSGLSYEMITVNDHSPDNVITVLHRLAREDKRVKVVDLAKNSGKESALMAGFRSCSGEIVVMLDDDGQCPMDKLWELTDPLSDGYDVAIANYGKKKQSGFKNFGSKVNDLMTVMLLDKPRELRLSNFIAMKKFIVDEVAQNTNPFPYFLGVVLRSTSRIVNVKMEERERVAGTGNFTFSRSLSMWLNGFTAFSVKPLRISSMIGFFCAIAGFVFGIITVIRKLVVPNISIGWSSTIATMLFIGGLQMLMLGMIGEYIGRIYISLNNRSQYVIKEKINFDEDAAANNNTNNER